MLDRVLGLAPPRAAGDGSVGGRRVVRCWERMDEELVEAFWAESTPYVRRLFLDEAVGRDSGAAQFEFDVVDVVLDFDRQIATVHDVLEEGRSAVAPLAAFLARAAAYGDDPSEGDGLTQVQHRPPSYRAAVDGTVERTEPTT